MIKDEVLSLLLRSPEDWLSGAALAKRLSVSHTAVWKAVEQLRAEGYEVESVTNKGYRLLPRGDLLSAQGVESFLNTPGLRLQYVPSLPSTNTALKAMAAEGAPEGTVLIAGEQTAGRGRMGRSFYSPPGSGLYLSLLLRPQLPAAEAVRLTACAAVAVAEAVEALSGLETQIKWVNDVLIGGKKICGILTEGSLDIESGRLSWAVVGIGVNTAVPVGDFPPELRDTAGAVFGAERPPALRCRLAAGILDRLADYCARPADPAVFEAYRSRSLVLGREITVHSPGKEPEAALALDLDSDFGLLVRLADGSVRQLGSGEVSVRT